MKKRKSDSNSKSRGEIPEVLVLPPRTLLDKFGISLGDIDKFLDIQKSCNDDAPLHHAPEKCEKSDTSDTQFVSSYTDLSESSIMKTANLMKKSLFLSPTFTNSHLVDASVCEVLPSSASSVVGINIFDTGNYNSGQELIPHNDSEELSERSTTKKQIHEKLYENKKDQSEIDIKTISITKHENSVSEKIDIENSKDLNILKSSSNSNLSVSIDSISLIHNKSLPVIEDIAEIQCIKISSSEKEVKNIQSTKHEQINTELKGRESPNIDMKLNTESSLKKLDNLVIEESFPNEIVIENKKELIKCAEKHILPSQFDIVQRGQKSSKTCNLHQNTSISDSITTADVTKYLHNKKTVTDNRCALQCKSDIQGVEKPGGDKEFDLLNLNREKNPKIYRSKETLKVDKENKTPHFFELVIADYNIDVEDSCKVNIVKNFCVCSDFGSFDYYSLEYYEHIHFWKHKNIKCSRNVIFSIYYDDNNRVDYNNSFETVEDDENESEYICINNREIEYEIVSNVSEESPRTLEATLIDVEVPMIYESQPAKEIQSKIRNSTETNRLYEVEVNVASNELEMQTMADNSKLKISPQKQRNKRKLKRVRNEDSPQNKKTRVDSKISEEFAASSDVTCAKDESCGLPEITLEDHSKTEKSDVICAICHQGVLESKWYEHIARQHNYLAWKEGDALLDVTNGEVVKEHLTKMLLKFGVLVCSTCGVERSEASKYLSHINSCERLPGSFVDSQIAEGVEVRVKCSACQVEVSDWYDHIGSAHNYLAYKEGDPPVDFENDAAIRRHLGAISKEYNGLICTKCGCRLQFVKPYLKHIQQCALEESCDNSVSSVNCGVCNEEVIQGAWMQHIEQEHDYLAWESGEAPLDVNDPEAVNRHLYKILKQIDGLVCTKCGCRRKYVKSYLTHISQCTSKTGYSPSKRRYPPIRRVESPNSSIDNSVTATCGVCGLVKEELEWLDHIEKEHNYLAWKFGDPPIDLNNMRSMTFHLNTISKNFTNGFLCMKCGDRHKLVRVFLKHIQTCKGDLPNNDSVVNDSNLDNSITNGLIEQSGNVTCGVCKKSMEEQLWIKHIEEEHFYLAWKETDKELDLEDMVALRDYLYTIVQKQGYLTCNKCGRKRKYAKSFLAHLTECGTDINLSLETTDTSFQVEDTEPTAIIKCGVCQKEMEYRKWEVHLRVHEYIAWKEGETPLDSNDEQFINAHLYDMSKMYKGLTCGKCNTTKKYVKSYRSHVASCGGNLDVEAVTENQENRDTYECAICHEKGPVDQFKSHAMNMHYNVAWIVGDIPIDVRNVSAVEKYLKEYQKSNGTLKCRKCGSTRASLAGFFAHVVQCGLSEESMDMYKSVCDICNAKYLGVYKHAHMAIHRTEEAKRRLVDKKPEVDDIPDASGKRRAAQKAKNVIKNITEVTKDTEDADDEGDFNCPEESSSSESDDSGETEIEEGESVHGTDVDSDLSDTETRVRYRKPAVSTFTTSNYKRIPFNVQDPDVYIAKTFKDFTTMHFSSTTLFPEWLNCEYEPVRDAELPKYMPPLKESCQVKSGSKTTTYKLFEAKCDKELSLFVGASIQSISWAPSCGKQAYLAVNCHNGTDAPRVNAKEILEHPGLIQIWDFKDLQRSPSFVFGLAHDLGTVWGMDWCPSGACEVLPHEIPKTFVRLGLLAVACSNGLVCIFSVPYPPTVTRKDKLVFKLKPVAELRLFRDTNKKVQATAISWSMQKGHACIAVGYGNGMTAKYDLESDSPLLTCVEDGVKIFYPFHDERPHTACITDVKTFACGADLCGDASTSPCGVSATLGDGRVHLPLTAERLLPAPHWPAILLAGNTDIITQAINEVDWWGHGRRLGSMNSGCGCLFCGRMAAFFPPLLKTMALHPAYNDNRDSQVKAKIDIMSLQNTEDSKPNNTQSLEPRSYEEMIELYGIQFNLGSELKRKDINRNMNKPKPRNAERYPLADITSMAFCPIAKHHTQLAIATFGGIIFVINT